VRPLATRHGITIDVTERQPALHVQADRQRLLQVVLNLLSNAVKYNDEQGHVQIASDADEHRVRLTVTDTGPGIAAADLERVFMPFDRLGAEQSAIEGTGVGLALSRALTEAMSGHIGVESTPNRGSTFWVDLPRMPPPNLRHTPADPSSAQAHGRPLVVLCIEDNVASANLIEHVLHLRPNVMLHTAVQGTLGLDLARNHHPDLILLDVHLPDLDGAEVLTELRRDPTTRDIPVVVVSADATPSQRSRLREMGAAHYLTKPLHINELLEIVDRLARHHPRPTP
jgi:CheY-like chemotaxis protein